MDELTLSLAITSITSGAIIGFFIGLSSIGGGSILWPMLHFLLGLPATTCTGTALAFGVITRMVGAISHIKHRSIERDLLAWVVAGGLPAVILVGALASEAKVHSPELTDDVIRITVGIVIGLSLLAMTWVWHRGDLRTSKTTSPVNRPKAIGCGILIGAVMGSTSIGGVFALPLLFILFRLSPGLASGTSLAITLIISLGGASVYQKYGDVHWPIAILMCCGSLGAVWVGSKVAPRLDANILRRIMLFVVLLAALVTLFFPRP